MKLNNDCVRDLLLYIEENVGIKDDVVIPGLTLSSYTNDELLYTALKLNEAGYLNARVSNYMDGSCEIEINSLTWQGHKFLDNIRDDGVWATTKGIVSKFSSVSLSVIENIASQVITNIINQQMGQSIK